MKKTVLATAVAMALGSVGAQAAQTYDFAGTFTFYDASGAFASSDTNVTGTFVLPDMTTPPSGQFTTTQNFNGYTWVADVDTMFFYNPSGDATQTFSYEWTNFSKFEQGGAGSYVCRTGVSIDGCVGTPGITLSTAVRGYSFDLTNAGQFGAGIFFDWSVNLDIPVLATLQITSDPTNPVLTVVSFDGRVSAINPPTMLGGKPYTYIPSPDNVPGNRMLVGPFPNQTPAFGGTMTPVPIPAAVWLFGSGLLGLVGVARRKKE